MAMRVKKTEMAGKGCLVQALGIILALLLMSLGGVFGVALGLFVGVVLLLWGSRLAIAWKCGACLNPLADRTVLICPVCKATLE